MTTILIFSLCVFTINLLIFLNTCEGDNSSLLREIRTANTYIYGAIVLIITSDNNFDLTITILVRIYIISFTTLITLIQILKHYAKS